MWGGGDREEIFLAVLSELWKWGYRGLGDERQSENNAELLNWIILK